MPPPWVLSCGSTRPLRPFAAFIAFCEGTTSSENNGVERRPAFANDRAVKEIIVKRTSAAREQYKNPSLSLCGIPARRCTTARVTVGLWADSEKAFFNSNGRYHSLSQNELVAHKKQRKSPCQCAHGAVSGTSSFASGRIVEQTVALTGGTVLN
jgi:hypothetical protein